MQGSRVKVLFNYAKSQSIASILSKILAILFVKKIKAIEDRYR